MRSVMSTTTRPADDLLADVRRVVAGAPRPKSRPELMYSTRPSAVATPDGPARVDQCGGVRTVVMEEMADGVYTQDATAG